MHTYLQHFVSPWAIPCTASLFGSWEYHRIQCKLYVWDGPQSLPAAWLYMCKSVCRYIDSTSAKVFELHSHFFLFVRCALFFFFRFFLFFILCGYYLQEQLAWREQHLILYARLVCFCDFWRQYWWLWLQIDDHAIYISSNVHYRRRLSIVCLHATQKKKQNILISKKLSH